TEAGRQQGAAMCFRQWRDSKSTEAIQRAYSFLHIKSFNEDERIIEGVATTPTPDRVSDVVDPMGAKFNLPMPLLWQHRHDQPIGEIFWANPTKDGIPFKGRIAKTDEPGTLKSRLDEAWQSIKLKLVRAVSIGFRALEMEPINPKDPFGGQRFKQWEWLELSAVTIPANVDASIQIVRSIDKELRAATGKPQLPDLSSFVFSPGDTGSEQTKPASVLAPLKTFKIEKDANMAKKTNSERIVDLENRRAAEVAAREAIQQKVTDEGRTKDEAEQQAFDEHSATIKGIDRELVDCRLIEAEAKAAAVPVQGQSMELATQSRGGAMRVSMKANRPAGIGIARVALAKMAGSVMQRDPILVAQERWPGDDELHAYMKTAVASINTINNGEELSVSQNMPSE
ncbi:MAG TPA: HK97 family phage prohead protease, partial [Anaerolineae bacterium]|nr:HK97 family phage prohead protease [Anaerolineae bacterium]